MSSSAALGAVNLEFRPAVTVVTPGGFADIGLYAVSDSAMDQSMSVVEVILNWDPAKLALVGLINNGPYTWLSSSFPNDAAQDGLNAPFAGTPANDGDAWYNALSRFPPNPTAMATPGGLLVTTFRFQHLAGASLVSMPAQAGTATYTQVLSGEVPGLVITGTLGGPVLVTDVPPGCDDMNECTDDTFDVELGCVYTDNSDPCDDADDCTVDDVCADGECAGDALCILYGDIAPLGGDCLVELADILCGLAGYSIPADCPQADIHPCPTADGLVELGDILALLGAYAGNPQCPNTCEP